MPLTGTESILVVDDEKILAGLAQDILKMAGFSVTVTLNGEEALQELQNNHYDLLFTDIIMPRMNGYELVRKSRQILPDLKILLTSGYTLNQEQADIDQVLLDNVLAKPYGDKKLVSAIRQCLDE